MIVWRVSKHQSLAESTVPGRWNLKGSPALYTSNSPSLCAWEVFAHQVDAVSWPEDLLLLKIQVKEKKIIRVATSDLPPEWNVLSYKNSVRKYGTSIFSKNDILGFWIPSVVVPEDFNIVLNPMFPNYPDLVTLVDTYPFNYDKRFQKIFGDTVR